MEKNTIVLGGLINTYPLKVKSVKRGQLVGTQNHVFHLSKNVSWNELRRLFKVLDVCDKDDILDKGIKAVFYTITERYGQEVLIETDDGVFYKDYRKRGLVELSQHYGPSRVHTVF